MLSWLMLYLGAFYSSSQNSYMGAYLGVGACLGHYGSYSYVLVCNVIQVLHSCGYSRHALAIASAVCRGFCTGVLHSIQHS